MRISDWSSDVCSSDLIIDPAGIIAEHSVGKGLALADRDRRQLHPVGDVAHRIDAGAARAVVVVHLDRALGVECDVGRLQPERSEEHTSELQSLMRISYAVFCLKKNKPSSNIDIRKEQSSTTGTNIHVV